MASETGPLPRAGGILFQPSASPVATLTYRSRAVAPMSELDLHRLARAAQLRNRAEGVTGLMVYDHGWIYQRLEGTSVGLAGIWASILADKRHESIEVLSDAPSEQRLFRDWDLKLSIHGAQAGLGPRSVSAEPPALMNRLYRSRQSADAAVSSLLSGLPEPVSLVSAADAARQSRSALSDLISTVIVPRLCAARPLPGADPRSLAATLVPLLIAADAGPAFALIEAAPARYHSLGTLAMALLEPAARCLGDLWQSDDCSDVEVTLGLIRLQAIAREFGNGTEPLFAQQPPVVLVTPQPGEPHMLGAALDAEMLWHAGWEPLVDFPASSAALGSLVANTWFDVLDLSLSSSFARAHRFGELERTITSARAASLNPDLVVVVSGRIFAEQPDAAAGSHLDADATFGSASQAEAAIVHALHRRIARRRSSFGT